MATSKKTASAEEAVTIKKLNLKEGIIWVKGNAPLVVHKFSHKAKMQIMAKQAAGSTAKSKKVREAKDFTEVFNGARHISTEGWDGFPASAFRKACISACRLVNFKMTLAKLSIFFEPDGWENENGGSLGLVRIIGGEPQQFEAEVRLSSGSASPTTDIAVRPMWRPGEWGFRLHVKYDADQFSASDIVNLIYRAGIQVGIGEGRPDSKSSAGMGWGTFEVSTEEEVMKLMPPSKKPKESK